VALADPRDVDAADGDDGRVFGDFLGGLGLRGVDAGEQVQPVVGDVFLEVLAGLI